MRLIIPLLISTAEIALFNFEAVAVKAHEIQVYSYFVHQHVAIVVVIKLKNLGELIGR